jgi:hypothetical protein
MILLWLPPFKNSPRTNFESSMWNYFDNWLWKLPSVSPINPGSHMWKYRAFCTVADFTCCLATSEARRGLAELGSSQGKHRPLLLHACFEISSFQQLLPGADSQMSPKYEGKNDCQYCRTLNLGSYGVSVHKSQNQSVAHTNNYNIWGVPGNVTLKINE